MPIARRYHLRPLHIVGYPIQCGLSRRQQIHNTKKTKRPYEKHYLDFAEWQGIEPCSGQTLKNASDSFGWSLHLGGRGLTTSLLFNRKTTNPKNYERKMSDAARFGIYTSMISTYSLTIYIASSKVRTRIALCAISIALASAS